jgi:nucleotide-binding universal stress UspA family protein
MDGGTGRVPRMIVGISRSRASVWALAWAVGEARRRGARLLLVHVFRPPAAPVVADYRYGVLSVPRDPYGDRMEHGYALIHRAIAQAVDWMPGDVTIEQQVVSGRPAVELARLAQGDDVVVL